jgi:hypothetical protein
VEEVIFHLSRLSHEEVDLDLHGDNSLRGYLHLLQMPGYDARVGVEPLSPSHVAVAWFCSGGTLPCFIVGLRRNDELHENAPLMAGRADLGSGACLLVGDAVAPGAAVDRPPDRTSQVAVLTTSSEGEIIARAPRLVIRIDPHAIVCEGEEVPSIGV